MKQRIYLIGTCHPYQVRSERTTPSDGDAFATLVTDAADQYAVRLIAEEMNQEALKNKWHVYQTICEEVARTLGVCHCHCDPDLLERAALGIERASDSSIRLEAFLTTPVEISQKEAEKEYAASRLRAKHNSREEEWLRRISGKNLFPTLFVCGARHVDNFCELCKRHGLHVSLLHRDWKPA